MKKVLYLGLTFYVSVIMLITCNNHNLFDNDLIETIPSTS
jgi:hypothetical protein